MTPSQTLSARRAVAYAAALLLPVAAITLAWYFTVERPTPASSTDHDHGAMAMTGDSARAVALLPKDQQRIGVTFAPVTSGPLLQEVRATGQVTVDETRLQTISSRVEGWVERLYVDFTGQAIARGAPLLALHSPTLTSAQQELLVAHTLAQHIDSASGRAHDDAALLVTAARRRLLWWGLTDDELDQIVRTRTTLPSYILRAPAAGYVMEKLTTTGQRVMPGDVLYRTADLSTVWVEAEVYEQDLRSIAVGQVALAEFDALQGERVQGRIAYINPVLTPDTRTARVRVALANPGLRFRPGMFATLTLQAGSIHSTLSVPRGAVLVTGERQLVFVRHSNGQLEPRQVRIGTTTHERIEILRGLSMGDTVVASATFLVDAESNLGTALGGMGDMPGMEVTRTPTALGDTTRRMTRRTPPRS